MFGTQDDGLQPKAALPAAGGSISGMRILMGVLLLMIAVAAISGVVVALTSGQPTIAFIIGLVAVAFFSRIGC
jgi:cytochrome b subunit of formate dehydrogenase